MKVNVEEVVKSVQERLLLLETESNEEVAFVNQGALSLKSVLLSKSDIFTLSLSGEANQKKIKTLKQAQQELEEFAFRGREKKTNLHLGAVSECFKKLREALNEVLDEREAKMKLSTVPPEEFVMKFIEDFSDGVLNDDKDFRDGFSRAVYALGQPNLTLIDLNEFHIFLEGQAIQVTECLKDSLDLLVSKTSNSIHSVILNRDDEDLIKEWLKSDLKQHSKWRLLCRGSTDGSSPETFHKLCDNQGPTLTIFQTINGKTLGGYNPNPWLSDESKVQDKRTFVFSLDLKSKVHFSSGTSSTTNFKTKAASFGCHTFYIDEDGMQKFYGVPGSTYFFGCTQVELTGCHLKTTSLKDFEVFALEV